MTGETKRFEITEDHLKLLKELEVGWDAMEFGAPAFDVKKPFGNGNVYKDMVKVLGWEVKITIDHVLSSDFDIDEDELPEKLEEELFYLYRQLDIVLEICLRTLSFEPGIYESDMYEDNWRKVL